MSTPLFGNVLIRPSIPHHTTKTGIMLPENIHTSKTGTGEIVAVGTGSLAIDGSLIPVQVKVGDVVSYRKYEIDPINIEGEELHCVDQRQIILKY